MAHDEVHRKSEDRGRISNFFGERGRLSNLFVGNRGYSRLSSDDLTISLLGSNDDDGHSVIKQPTKPAKIPVDKENDRRMLDEVSKIRDEIRKEVAVAKNEKRDQTETTKMEKMESEKTVATLKASIRKNEEQISALDRKMINRNASFEKYMEKLTAEVETRNAALDKEIEKLKKRIVKQEVNSLHNTPVKKTSTAPQPTTDMIEAMERPTRYDELFAWMIILTFFIGFLTGVQL